MKIYVLWIACLFAICLPFIVASNVHQHPDGTVLWSEAPEDKLYPGLLIQAHRFVAVWPFNESAAKKFSVKWIVNGVEKKHEHFDGPTTSSELILSNKCVHISVDVVKTPIDGTEPINFKLEYDATNGLPFEPTASFVDSKLHVDWSTIWPCDHVYDYTLEVIGRSGRIFANLTTLHPYLDLDGWAGCELAELCVTARDKQQGMIGRRCLPDVLPHGKMQRPTVDQTRKKLRIEWTLPKDCHPIVVSVIVRSNDHTEIVYTGAGDSRRTEVAVPNWCSLCTVYVAAQYPFLNTEVSEPAVILGEHTDSILKPGLSVPDELVRCSPKENIFGVAHKLSYTKRIGDLYSLSWEAEADCPVIMYHFVFVLDSDHAHKTSVIMRDNECSLETIHYDSTLYTSLIKASGHIMEANPISFYGDDGTKIMICTKGGNEVSVIGPYEETSGDVNFRHYDV